MYSVLIVDDEKPAREMLKMLANFKECGFSVIAEATNGKDALEKYNERHPDLIITDIQMPLMDGIEFMKEVRKDNEKQRFVVLSCHESFSYAQSALKLGVIEYLIKDSATSEQLNAMLRSIGEAMKEEAKPISINGSIESDSKLTKDLLLSQILDLESIYANAVNRGNMCVMQLILKGLKQLEANMLRQISLDLEHELNNFEGGHAVYCGEGAFGVVTYLKTSVSELEMYNKRYTITQAFRSKLKEITDAKITIGVSKVYSSINQLDEMFMQAKHACGYSIFMGHGKTHYYDTVQDSTRTTQTEILELRMQRLESALENQDKQGVFTQMRMLYGQDIKGIMQFNYLNHVNSLLVSLISEECIKRDIAHRDIFGSDEMPFDMLLRQDSVEQIGEIICSYFDKLLCEPGLKGKFSQRINSVVEYIQDNYNKDISLSTIADNFNVHKVYLARTFKEETDMSINAYLNRLRMEKAKLLLRAGQIKVGEIVPLVGFNNPQNFYNLFKKYVGCSPKEYKEGLNIRGNF